MINELDQWIRSTAAALLAELPPKRKWVSARFELRGLPDGSSRISKFRYVGRDRNTHSVDVPFEVSVSAIHIWEHRSVDPETPWYGLVMTLRPDGQHEVEFNYDSACYDAEGFFDD